MELRVEDEEEEKKVEIQEISSAQVHDLKKDRF